MYIDIDQPTIRSRLLPLPKKPRTVADIKDQTRNGPRFSHNPGPAPIPCGLPPAWSQEPFQSMLSTVETSATSRPAYTMNRRQAGSGDPLARWKANQELNRS